MATTTQKKRRANALRDVKVSQFPGAAPGSILIEMGETKIICTASVASDPPRWLPKDEEGNFVKGWVTAEYNMLPGSTPDRKRRGNDSRGTEIQRLIGRALRAAVDLKKMPGVAITCDCDVIKADGGTRTASITGAWIALSKAVQWAMSEGLIEKNPIKGPMAAISVGIIDGQAFLDLDYELDVRAEVDMNVAMNHKGQFVEVQGTGEAGVFSRAELDEMMDLAEKGIKKLIKVQKAALKS
ncbi:Ribonuclease PH [Poriferisphaera corsica]|uniref:Ribonuclease PH n=1 Tax=Poriferisphaera corsica TaxID=2528020 RepID=A0A517YV90_9BACT|nr:ribonuclease PH [Poriferisphaera corsica]QDU34144.1 Ribonuclease PH [Poriferisphaera corsica]